MKQSKTIIYPGPANEAIRRAAARMTSKHQYEITYSSDYYITFNKVRKLGLLQLLDYQQSAYNETTTLVADQVSETETRLEVGGSNRLARTDLHDTVRRIVAQAEDERRGRQHEASQTSRQEQPAEKPRTQEGIQSTVSDKPIFKTNISTKEQLVVFADRLEVRTGWSLDTVNRSLSNSEIENFALENGLLTITDRSGEVFVNHRPTRAKKVYEAIKSMQAVNA